MEEVKLNYLLIGKTGCGKSATGNMILNKRVFKTSANVTSETKVVKSSFSQFGKYVLLVVDGPGLEDTAMNKAQDKITATKHMDIALAMCYGGVDAFLLVLKFGNRFTEEDKMALEALKKIFGDNFIKHVIVVVTCGDNFQGAMEEQNRDISFHGWCREQEAIFQELYENCEGRFVLFNNREKDEEGKRAQIQEVVNLAEGLQKRCRRYTSQCFEAARYEREKLILTLRAPELKEEIQKHISLLTEEIEDLYRRPSDETKAKIRDRVLKLRSEIDREDQGYGILNELRVMVDQVLANLNDVEKLISLAKQLEEKREAKKRWGVLGTICTLSGGAVALAAAPVTLAVAAGAGVVTGVGALLTGIGLVSISNEESGIRQQQKEIESRRKK